MIERYAESNHNRCIHPGSTDSLAWIGITVLASLLLLGAGVPTGSGPCGPSTHIWTVGETADELEKNAGIRPEAKWGARTNENLGPPDFEKLRVQAVRVS